MSAAAMMSKMLGVGLMSAFGLVGGLFIAGEVLTDPGGWQGVLLVSIWAVPMVALVLMAVLRPRTAAWLLVLVVAAAGVAVLLDVLTPAFGSRGPVSAVVIFAVAVPSGLLGIHRVGEAGLLVLAAVSLQILDGGVGLARLRRDGGGPSVSDALTSSDGIIIVPLLVCAVFLLVSAALDRSAHARQQLRGAH